MFHSDCHPEDSDAILNSNLVKKKKVKWELHFDENEGRYLRASEEIKAGETIFEEYALNRGPSFVPYSTQPVCLGCYQFLGKQPSERHICKQCGWPLCSVVCENSPEHLPECQMFSTKNVKMCSKNFKYGDIEPMYDIICPVRILWQREHQPEKWLIFWKLMSHVEDWMESSKWKESHQMITKYITEVLKLDNVDERLILTIFGIFYTNDFSTRVVNKEVGDKRFAKVRLCYPLAAMCSHSCVPNTSRRILGLEENFLAIITASQTIKKGDNILFTYLDIMLPTIVRQNILRKGKKFTCTCPRCLDPTEMGTFGNALICQKCKQKKKGKSKDNNDNVGLIMAKPKNWTDSSNTDSGILWECNSCGFTKSEKDIENQCLSIHEESETLIDWVPDRSSISKFETFIKKYEGSILHPNHMLLTNIKYSLAGFYGRLPGYEMEEMDVVALSRKKQICEEVLKVLNRIDQGISPRRGMLMYEIHMPIIMLAKMEMDNGNMSKDDAKKEFRRAISNLKMSLEMLKYEPDGCFEKNIYHGAKGSVATLESFISTL